MNMTFQYFLINGRTSFVFGESYGSILDNFKNYKLYEIDKNSGSFAVHYDGVELLFDDYKLCLVQYEISRVFQLYINKNKITKNTSINEFKSYLDEINVSYLDEEIDGQRLLVTDHKVKIYFEETLFSTAIKSW
ncbi:hypothetical protein F6Q07_22945 [Pectobacterium parmentieri]|uniref:hypothetical protein n=1 Tax=Pectobacterium parmentieri TaxID=1905730 RepID=UPI000EB3CA55|nr:hypothetical protein [Pectobacterium parmentieri]AYH02947.1 hypothetical protein C5E26_19435 [Pectobacterium parmentieri]AYH29206.1 hypothetical protein C5E20_19790 [Pectobacterium parmentieri]AYH33624.1 hypothetical protein C5E19_19420 [Pectobacterium parmentieri]MBI0520912.1 hypothetical protein [Pectobacterium parmentieri]